MILIINICKEQLHYSEFVKPIEDILAKDGIKFSTKHYKNLAINDSKKAERIIIPGTSLKDNGFIKDLDKFSWIKTIDKPLLGICAGMQIIGLLFNGKIKSKTEIGFYEEDFNDFLGLNGIQQVYHLHNNYVDSIKEFNILSKSDIPQAIKHKNKEIYGVLFHPEVRDKDFILNFVE